MTNNYSRTFGWLLFLMVYPAVLAAQQLGVHPRSQLDSLIATALRVAPALQAAEQGVRAATARVGPAGTPPDYGQCAHANGDASE